MTQSAQSHRQMRSIPHCHKAVFYVFVFDSIHDSVTMHGVSHHLASPMAASAFVPVPIGGFSTESGLFLLYIKNRLERGFAPADWIVI